jgi:hypothetical protein
LCFNCALSADPGQITTIYSGKCPWMSNSYVMSTGGLESAPTHGKYVVISQVLSICGWYSIKAAYQKDIHGVNVFYTPTYRRPRRGHRHLPLGGDIGRFACQGFELPDQRTIGTAHNRLIRRNDIPPIIVAGMLGHSLAILRPAMLTIFQGPRMRLLD